MWKRRGTRGKAGSQGGLGVSLGSHCRSSWPGTSGAVSTMTTGHQAQTTQWCILLRICYNFSFIILKADSISENNQISGSSVCIVDITSRPAEQVRWWLIDSILPALALNSLFCCWRWFLFPIYIFWEGWRCTSAWRQLKFILYVFLKIQACRPPCANRKPN